VSDAALLAADVKLPEHGGFVAYFADAGERGGGGGGQGSH
jgi:hypothetical protein